MTVQLQTIFARETHKNENVNLLYILAITDYSWDLHDIKTHPILYYNTSDNRLLPISIMCLIVFCYCFSKVFRQVKHAI